MFDKSHFFYALRTIFVYVCPFPKANHYKTTNKEDDRCFTFFKKENKAVFFHSCLTIIVFTLSASSFYWPCYKFPLGLENKGLF